MTYFEEPSSEEAGQQNQPLITDLRRMFTPSDIAQSLTRVRQRLDQSIADGPQPVPLSHQPITFPKKGREGRFFSRPMSRSLHGMWYQRLNMIAAVLIVGLLISTFFVLSSRFHTGSSGHPSVPTEHEQATLSNITMVNETTGWARATGAVMLRTTDGGLHWVDVSPQGLPPTTYWFGDTAFRGTSTAWLSVTVNKTRSTRFQPAGISYVFHTTNGGKTWEKVMLQTNDFAVASMTFVDAMHGWLFTVQSTASPYNQFYGPFPVSPRKLEMFRTTDGGATWVKISSDHFPLPMPVSDGHAIGMGFASASTGWLAAGSSTQIQVTHDGGVSWQWQTLPPPPRSSSCSDGQVWPPQFFTAQDGILSLVCGNPAGLITYVTHDGGTTWNASPILPLVPTKATWSPDTVADTTPQPFFLDVNHGWLEVSENNTHELYMTSDGGQHWTRLIPAPDPYRFSKGLATPGFISDKVGLTFSYSVNQKNEPESILLFKTVDSGRTWTLLHPIFPDYVIP